MTLHTFLDRVPSLAWSANSDRSLDFFNPRFQDYTGLSSDQLYKSDWKSAVHRDDIQQLETWWHDLTQSQEAGTTEMRLRRFDGEYRWFQIAATPVHDEQSDNDQSREIIRWYVTAIDIDDRKRAEEKLLQSEADLRTITNNIPGFVHTMSPAGEVEFVNQQILEYFGKTSEELKDWTRGDACHPDDLPRVVETLRRSIEAGQACDIEVRCRRADGAYRWFQSRGRPVRNAEGQITAWYFLLTDIDDRKRAEQKLRQSEQDLRTITDAIANPIVVMAPDGTTLYGNQVLLDLTGFSSDALDEPGFWDRVVHPDDANRLQAERRERLVRGDPFDLEFRIWSKSGQYRWHLTRYNPLKDESGKIIRWYATGTDIDDRKRAEQELQRSEAFLAEGQRHSRTGTFSWRIATDEIIWSEQLYRIFEFDERLPVTLERIGSRVHPDDLQLLQDMIERARNAAQDFEYHHRLLMPDQSVKHIHLFAHATRDMDGRLEYVGAAQDVTGLHTITDAIANPIVTLTPDGTRLYANRVAWSQLGLTRSDAKNEGSFPGSCHPGDFEPVRDKRRTGLLQGVPFELEMRLFKNGEWRWHLSQYNPLRDESGKIIRWYVTGTDIDERKKAEERLQNENLVLREEIDRSSMFEEIVGSSTPMGQLLKKVEKVAPSDSTVLILGETGTGKELIARALHRRSKRANKAFMKVNCAAIPQSLIASELFGHEKGAFTGALQRRVGRFEAANGGTLFLDEIGELPMETQIALLRVLQEREFERVGSNHPISVDVRLIAATNRDLPAAVAAGTFRQDLFYRLNVFPIAVPPLRERSEDIPLLVEYFVGRFAKDAGKNIRHMGKQTLEQLQTYNWPGNIRELQNVVERAVILCEADTFVVDESWLERDSEESSLHEGLSALEDREVEMIESALAETHGRISGPSGAAAKLGIPRQTLESKIRRLGIDKYGQKRSNA
ncbi:MAG TPA: sigma 54-interacting transcriptional regulator [Terriglobales bacterium]|nr:sigma 54-interacting transcriptional regulator [Terriglobales bacterium]